MKNLIRIVFWTILFFLFCLLFYVSENRGTDNSTYMTLYTDSGAVSMTMAEYLPRAVAAEMPALYGEEALKAQATAIRTYVMSAGKHGEMSVCTDSGCCLAYMSDDELHAVWGDDFGEYFSAVESAVRQTDGQYLAWENEPAITVFHASSCEYTENCAALWSDIPYLVSVETPETADVSALSFTPDELAQRLDLSPDSPPDEWLESVRYEDTGRIKAVLICGQCFSGTYLRSALGLSSTDADISFDGTEFLFTVRGKGHGIGMSQKGADVLAGSGWSYERILAHYYPGTELIFPGD